MEEAWAGEIPERRGKVEACTWQTLIVETGQIDSTAYVAVGRLYSCSKWCAAKQIHACLRRSSSEFSGTCLKVGVHLVATNRDLVAIKFFILKTGAFVSGF